MTTQVAVLSGNEPNKPKQRHGLFRKQAVEKQKDRLLGDLLLIPAISYSIFIANVALFVFASLKHLDRLMLIEYNSQKNILNRHLSRLTVFHAKTNSSMHSNKATQINIVHIKKPQDGYFQC